MKMVDEFADLLNPDEALDARIRALYRLKSLGKSLEGARILLSAIDKTDSVLLQHELAYNVGQFGQKETIPDLEKIIDDEKYDEVTRHEAIEALGAIGDDSALPFLERYAAESICAPLKESAVLAICRIRLRSSEGDASVAPPRDCPYVSVDPSPAFNDTKSVKELEFILCDESGSTSLWDRYRAMFSLRNIGSKEAALTLGRALRSDTSSCLFRHEIAFVLGQLEHSASEPYLAEALMDEGEHGMVRHEAAEALGAIADKSSWDLLERYSDHPEGIVRDSCIVALDMHRYWSQYKTKDGAE